MKHRSVRSKPALELFEERHLLSAGGPFQPQEAALAASFRPAGASLPAQTLADSALDRALGHGRGHSSRRPRSNAFSLINDQGTLSAPLVQVRAGSVRLNPGAIYNVAVVTVRNGTSQTFSSASGFEVKLTGAPRFERFPTGSVTWKPNQVFMFYELTESMSIPSFTFNLKGERPPVMGTVFFGIKYNPNTLPGILNGVRS